MMMIKDFNPATLTDGLIKKHINVAMRTMKLVEAMEGCCNGKDTSLLFEGYEWPKGGAKRKDVEFWLKATSGYTSNRSMQTIINNAIAQGVIHKDLKTGKYHPGRDNSAA